MPSMTLNVPDPSIIDVDGRPWWSFPTGELLPVVRGGSDLSAGGDTGGDSGAGGEGSGSGEGSGGGADTGGGSGAGGNGPDGARLKPQQPTTFDVSATPASSGTH